MRTLKLSGRLITAMVKQGLLILLAIVMVIYLDSCYSHYFTEPQPVDARNRYSFKKNFVGEYGDPESGQTYLIIGKNYWKFKEEPQKIYNGTYFNPADTVRRQFYDDYDSWLRMINLHNKPCKCINRIWFDSLGIPTDTALNYIFRGEKIYEIMSDGALKNGVNYTIEGDTIFTEEFSTVGTLGPTSFLRKLARDIYVLNLIRGFTEEEQGMWWTIMIIERLRDGSLRIIDTFDTSESFYENGDNSYYDVKWTKATMLKWVKLLSQDSSRAGTPIAKLSR